MVSAFSFKSLEFLRTGTRYVEIIPQKKREKKDFRPRGVTLSENLSLFWQKHFSFQEKFVKS